MGLGILARYTIKAFLLYFLGCFISLITIGQTFLALSEIRLLEQPNGAVLFVNSLLAALPLLIESVASIAILLGTILAFSSMSKTSEIVSMQAAGLSNYQLVRPVLLVGLLVACFLYFSQSYLAPWWGSDLKVSLIQKKQEHHTWRYHHGTLYYFAGLDQRALTSSFGYAYKMDESSHTIKKMQLLGATFVEEEKVHFNVLRQFDLEGSKVTETGSYQGVTPRENYPALFQSVLMHPKYSNLTRLGKEILIKSEGGENYDLELFAFYQKIAGFCSVFVMILLALPFSLFSGRSSNAKAGIVLAIVLGFVFWLIEQLFFALFNAGILGPLVGAFGTVVVFFCFAVYLLKTKKT